MLARSGAGFTGYSLPDDLLLRHRIRARRGLHPVASRSWVLTSRSSSSAASSRARTSSRGSSIHVLLIPGLLLGLIAAHMGLVALHKHTQYPGPGRTNKNVVGFPMMPVYMAKAGGFFFIVFGVVML